MKKLRALVKIRPSGACAVGMNHRARVWATISMLVRERSSVSKTGLKAVRSGCGARGCFMVLSRGGLKMPFGPDFLFTGAAGFESWIDWPCVNRPKGPGTNAYP